MSTEAQPAKIFILQYFIEILKPDQLAMWGKPGTNCQKCLAKSEKFG